MNLAHALGHEVESSPMSDGTPIVFVVDDDVSVRESLELLIRCKGWQPEIFASAQELLSRPRVLVPSCLILDVSLPGLNGLDLQKRIASDRIDMPIIFITGHGDIPMSVQAIKAGAIGGENVYSGEVEAVIYQHPAVSEAAVFGIPDPLWGELVMAIVVLKPGKTLSAQELIAHCRRALANYKIPRHVEFAETELPKGGCGKILKRTLRERFWDRQVRAVG
jgi:CheY-like chemotaxis protein